MLVIWLNLLQCIYRSKRHTIPHKHTLLLSTKINKSVNYLVYNEQIEVDLKYIRETDFKILHMK
jgi:hypothetical protein